MREKCYSTNDEDFDFSEIEEAAQECWDNSIDEYAIGDITTLYEADCIPHKASDFAPYVSEYMGNRAYDEVGEECANGWEFSKEQAESLQKAVNEAIDKWADENNMHPRFYSVGKSRAIRVKFVDEDGGIEILEKEEN